MLNILKRLFLSIALINMTSVVQAQTGIGTSSPDPSARIDISSSNKGVLLPRVALLSAADATTIVSPAPSLLIYNTNASLPSGAGVYINAGSAVAPSWLKLVTNGAVDATHWDLDGNTLTASKGMGTKSNHDLPILTNNSEKMRVTAGGQVAIGSAAPSATAVLDVNSTTQGVLVSRMTTEQRDAISEPASGLLIYNTTIDCFNYFDVSIDKWVGMGCEAYPTTVSGVVDCTSSSVQGTYKQGTTLTGSNTVTLVVQFNSAGTYNISATANGMTFARHDTATAGTRTIVLTGSGTPVATGPTVLVVAFSGSDCSVVINVQESVATFASCGSLGAQVGSLVAGTIASGVNIPLTLTYTGGDLYTINSSPANGLSISSPTSGTLEPSPAILNLVLSGTPLLVGNTTLNYGINARTGCSITVPVTSGTGRASSVVCTGLLSGTYTSGTAMGGTNTKVVTLNVGTAGTFTLRTPTLNGVYFAAGPVTLAAGLQNVTLGAVGTPSAPGLFSYTVTASNSPTTFVTCSFSVLYSVAAGVANYTTIPCGMPGAEYTYIKASNTESGDQFGHSQAISADGLTLAVGAYNEDGSGTGINPTSNNALGNSGAVYVYTRISTISLWTFQAYIKASNPDGSDWFGFAVALNGNGNTMVVGAFLEDGSGTGINPTANNLAGDAGAAYVFTRSGSTWTQQAYIKASNTGGADWFGRFVALSSDGNTMAVSSHLEDGSGTGVNPTDNNLAPNAGAVYVFSRSGSTWTQQAYVKSLHTQAVDYFGGALDYYSAPSIALSDDGNTLAVGSIGEDGSGTGINPVHNNSAGSAGAVYIYTRSGATWTSQAYIKASNTGANDFFGESVALSSDGNTLAVGAFWEDGSGTGPNPASNNSAPDAGAVYVYTRSGSTWTHQAYLKASNPDVGDYFGTAVALSDNGNVLAIGALQEDGGGSCINGVDGNTIGDAGAAYIWNRSGSAWTQQAIIRANNVGAVDRFGRCVSISADGKVMSVGANYEDGSGTGINPTSNNSYPEAGAVYIYTGN